MVAQQLRLLDVAATPRRYHDSITALLNAKGCMDVDTVKGCTAGMSSEPGGCYGECYAAKIATRYGLAFEQSVSRGFVDRWQHRDILVRQLRGHSLPWYRIGVMGDPSHDWGHTLGVIRQLRPAVGGHLLEIPAGRLHPGEDPAECGRRELAEETGLSPRALTPLGRFYPSPGVFDEVIHLFLGTGLSQGDAAPEHYEEIEKVRLPISEALRRAVSGEILDGKTITALLRAEGALRGAGGGHSS